MQRHSTHSYVVRSMRRSLGSSFVVHARPRCPIPRQQPARKLAERVALITDGCSGIGRAVATLFAREGAEVALMHAPCEREEAAEIARTIKREGGHVVLIGGDIGDPAFCRKAVGRTLDEFDQLDILVNTNAFLQYHDIEELDEEQWGYTFRVCVHGCFFMVKAALPYLPSGGTIINTGSIVSLEGGKDLLDYAAAKGAIHAFTKSLARMLAERGIRVNCVAPGPVWSQLDAERGLFDESYMGTGVAIWPPIRPEELAPAYVFLASQDSSSMSGEILPMVGVSARAA